MSKGKMIRLIFDMLIAVLLPLFLLSLLYFISGSQEMAPTAEQQEKVRAVTLLVMVVTGVPCLVCIGARVKCRKKPT